MTRQEKIQDGVEKLVSKAYWYEGEKNIVVDITKEILSYLHSQGIRLPDGSSLVEVKEALYGHKKHQG